MSAIESTHQLNVQQRWFYQDALDNHQADTPTSLAFESEWYTDWNQGNDSLVFKPFIRIDSNDSERSHIDIRELFWLHVSDSWEFGLGINKVFWGVTESQHLVDIINQTDTVEAPDGEEKLGQPMIRWSTSRDWGNLHLFVLPGFRERTFPGEEGRLRDNLVVKHGEALYESAAEEKHVDIAARWAHSIGLWDVATSVFKGTSREPEFRTITVQGAEPFLRAYYPQITQFGVDAQLTTDAWLWKIESIFRHSSAQDYSALTGGFEYTVYSLFNSTMDLGLLAEYSYDSRNSETSTGLEDDLFVGARLVRNDTASTELLMGITQDLDNSESYSGKLEASSRVGESTKLYFEVWVYNSDTPEDVLYSFRQDSFVELSIECHF